MNDVNIYRERREVLDNILDRMRLLETQVVELTNMARFSNIALGLVLVLIIYIAIKLP